MVTDIEPHKAKIAKRVFEVFEYLCNNGQKATVKDIVRRYGRPQSSTSELLASMVEMGLLYKDPLSRSFMPTPRIAALGTGAQPEIFRDGRLFSLMDRFAISSGKHCALFGMVGTHVQIFRISGGIGPVPVEIAYGASELLSSSTVGLLLLSTFPRDRIARMLRRLNAEAAPDRKFNLVECEERIDVFRRQRHAIGALGFAPGLQVAAALLPRASTKQPLVIGTILQENCKADTKSLLSAMNRGLAKCFREQTNDSRKLLAASKPKPQLAPLRPPPAREEGRGRA